MGWPTWLLTAAGLKIFKGGDIHDADTGFRVNGLAASGKVLRGDGTNFISANPRSEDLTTTYRFRVHRATASAAQVFTTATNTTVQYDIVDYDPSGNWDAAAWKWTIPVTGYYTFHGMAAITGALDAVGTLYDVQIWKNGVLKTLGTVEIVDVAGLSDSHYMTADEEDLYTAGDLVQMVAIHTAGANRSSVQAAHAMFFYGHLKST